MEAFTLLVAQLEERSTELDFYIEELGSFKLGLVTLLANNPGVRIEEVARTFPLLVFPSQSTLNKLIQRYRQGKPFKSIKFSTRRSLAISQCLAPHINTQSTIASLDELQYRDDEDIFDDGEDSALNEGKIK